ncbi:MAG TPA: hypothetical protein VKA44_02865 [Gemmatimonadota bacterium]|nr:hypothetical protein [Gemmatimonadota bacterium]
MSLGDVTRRSSALLLAALFLAGETGWSGIDALAFHPERGARDAAAAPAPRVAGHPVAHLEKPAAPGGHASHCVLGLSTGSARSSARVALDLRTEPAEAVATDVASRSVETRTDLGTQSRPRAPPSRTA